MNMGVASIYLVGGLEHLIFFHILGIITQTDQFFFRGVEAAKDTLLYPIPIFQTSNSSFIARCWMTRTNRDRFNRSPFNAQNLGILRAAAAAQLGVGAWLGNILFSGHSCSIGTRTFCGLGHWSDHFKFHRL